MNSPKFHEGDEVKALVTTDGGIYKGQTYVIEYAYSDMEGPSYSLSMPSSGSSGMEGLESELELTRTAKEMYSRKLPTVAEIIAAVPLSWDYDSGFDLNESNKGDTPDTIEMYGRSDNGLNFGFELKVTNIWETDF